MNYFGCWLASLLFFSVPTLSTASGSVDSLLYIKTSDEALQSRLWLIEQATEEILVSYYIFEDDGIGMVFLQELLLLKQRKPNVDIKILIDGSANGLSENLMYYLIQKGIQIREYNPLPTLRVPLSHISISDFFEALFTINSRMHDKLLIVDKKYLITGGRNIDGKYFGREKTNFLDRDILITSDRIGQETTEYFNHLWTSDRVKGLCPVLDHSKTKEYERETNRFLAIKNYMLNHPEYIRIKAGMIDFSVHGIPIENASFLHSYSNDAQDFIPKKLSGELNVILSKAEKEVIIETPYLLYTKNLLKVLKDLRKKNVRIVFITNSFCSTDIVAAAAAYDLRKVKLLELGIELYEYTGPSYLHAKCAIIDNKTGFVGTYNIDPRSAYINTETIFMYNGGQAVEILQEILEQDMQKGQKVELVNGKIPWVDQQCEKSDLDWLEYLLFQIISRIGWVYNLL